MNFIKYLFRTLFVLYIFLLFFFSFYSFKSTPVDLSKYILGIRADRIAHFVMFFPFPFSAWFAFGGQIKKITSKFAYSALFITGIVVVSFTEALQAIIPGRDSDWLDLVANYSSILMGTLLVILVDKYANNVWISRLQ